MLHNDPAKLSVRKPRQKLGPLIVDPAAALFDHLADRPALRVAPGDQPLRLRVEILFVLTRRHPCVHSDDGLFGWPSW